MQRADVLQPLSRQHKAALMTCLLIRKGISKQASVAVMTDFFLQCWEKDLAPHFKEEEEQIIPLLQKHEAGKPLADTILRDHDLIRTAITHLSQAHVNERLLEDLADQLEQHVRYEERIVFQSMQEFIPAQQLLQLKIHEDDHQPVCNLYSNHFWE
ncbi:hemerythrin domain-containing protein [Flavihumibacter stibioxidans]|uniref:Hemerythrin-like domain-containing protein n=1 Tax=Flavihumibacter stibioxidans TaxID=1834163 RepID=A0ABR7M336_9BACT|nr:hemerythrin domain-containing protein [Flavihumibacter stibioxidans]MBC6489425.1 hypothetical protein [Flavihumibacter stibioxidans]